MEYECPCCKTPLTWDTNNPWRPFCSERCKNKDFIAWANEENTLPDNNILNELDSFD